MQMHLVERIQRLLHSTAMPPLLVQNWQPAMLG